MKTNFIIFLLLLFIPFLSTTPSFAQSDCDTPIAQIDLAVNNVSARLLQGGSLWWDGNDGKYIFPAELNGAAPVSSMFAGGIWIGGVDPGGNLKLSANTYGWGQGKTDFWSGPLVANGANAGTTDPSTCANWDKFFVVTKADITSFLADWQDNGVLDNPIPISLRGWPSKGNPYFFDIHGFGLPNTSQGLAEFHDVNGNAVYNPAEGDYPSTKNADQAIWWVFNDLGNSDSGSTTPLSFEIQMMAYAYSSNIDAINNSTFYDVKIINRGIESLDSIIFSLWADPDLGCFTDDYLGCIPEENMAIIYNEDAVDGTLGCDCEQGVNTYCEEIPMIGIKVISNFHEAEFSSFLNYQNEFVGNPPPAQTDPENANEYYNLMTGRWKDGSPLLDSEGNETSFLFPDAPDDSNGWSMCTDESLILADRRMLMNFGSFRLDPGAVTSMTFAVIGVENIAHPCPSINPVIEAGNEIINFYNITRSEQIYLPATAVSFSPNPVTAQAILKLEEPDAEISNISIYNLDGRLILNQQNLSGTEYLFDRKNLSSGIYVYKLITGNGQVAVGRFVVQ